MTTKAVDFDRRLNEWFDSVEPRQAPAGLLPVVFRHVGHVGQQRGPLHRFTAAIEQAWAPRSRLASTLALVVLTALLIAALVFGAFAAGMLPVRKDAAVTPVVTDGVIAAESVFYVQSPEVSDNQIRFVDPQTGNDASITPPPEVASCGAVFSPDGSRYAFMLWDDSEPRESYPAYVAVASATDNSEPIRLFHKQAQNWFHPSWAPDSSAIVSTIEHVDADGNLPYRELWVLPADGSPGRRLGDVQASYAADWSSSGTWIAFVSVGTESGDGGHAVQIIRADGTDLRTLVPSGAGSVAWSPVTDELAYTSADGNLHVISIDGTELFSQPHGRDSQTATEIGVGDLTPTWSDDGTRIALTTDGVLKIFDRTTGSVSDIRMPLPITRAEWSASGASLAVITTPADGSDGALWEVGLDGTQRFLAYAVRGSCMSASYALDWQRVTK
jgi:Tol biopolymer transport system component